MTPILPKTPNTSENFKTESMHKNLRHQNPIFLHFNVIFFYTSPISSNRISLFRVFFNSPLPSPTRKLTRLLAVNIDCGSIVTVGKPNTGFQHQDPHNAMNVKRPFWASHQSISSWSWKLQSTSTSILFIFQNPLANNTRRRLETWNNEQRTANSATNLHKEPYHKHALKWHPSIK